MNINQALTYGLGIWLVAFVVASIMVVLGAGRALWADIVVALFAGLASFFLSKKLRLRTVGRAFGYGFVYLVVMLVLDYLITFHFTGSAIFQSWTFWLAYLLVFLAPFVTLTPAPKTSRKK